MAAGSTPAEMSASDRSWFIAQRWMAYEAEARANLLRIIAIGAFYLVHLWSYFSAQGRLPNFGVLQLAGAGEINKQFHLLVTLFAVAWAMLALGILLALQHRIFPSWLPYFSTGCDIVMLTGIVCIGSAARSPLVAGYFLILILSALRLSLLLVWFSTAGCALAYLCVLGIAKWPERFGITKMLGETISDLRVPRYHQMIMLLAIVLAGVMLGQIVRRIRRIRAGNCGAQPVKNRASLMPHDRSSTTSSYCPQCKALQRTDARECWLCGATLSARQTTAAADISVAVQQPVSSYSLASLMLFVTLLCVALGVSTIAPGVGIPLGIVLIVVWSRTAAVTRRRAAHGLAVTPLEKIELFASSFSVTIGLLGLVGIAGFAAFWAVCFACIGTYMGMERIVGDDLAIMLGWTVCGVAVIALLFVTIKFVLPPIVRLIRRRWRRDIGERYVLYDIEKGDVLEGAHSQSRKFTAPVTVACIATIMASLAGWGTWRLLGGEFSPMAIPYASLVFVIVLVAAAILTARSLIK